MLKKLIIACVALLVLTGCQDAVVTSPRNEPLFTIGGSTVTETDLFNVMSFNDQGSVILTHVQQVVLDVLVPDDEAFQTAVQAELQLAKEGYGEELWPTILQYYGFETDEEYIENVLAPQVQMKMALTAIMTEDFDNLVNDLYIRKAAILQVAKEDSEAALKALEDGTSWEDVASEFVKSGSSYTGKVSIYHKDTQSVDSTALSYIISAKENGISDALDIPSDNTAQFIINIVEADANNIKEEVIENFITDSTFQTKYISKMLKDNGFKVFDKNIYQAIYSQYPDALAN